MLPDTFPLFVGQAQRERDSMNSLSCSQAF
jgi:hypothetical protein